MMDERRACHPQAQSNANLTGPAPLRMQSYKEDSDRRERSADVAGTSRKPNVWFEADADEKLIAEPRYADTRAR